MVTPIISLVQSLIVYQTPQNTQKYLHYGLPLILTSIKRRWIKNTILGNFLIKKYIIHDVFELVLFRNIPKNATADWPFGDIGKIEDDLIGFIDELEQRLKNRKELCPFLEELIRRLLALLLMLLTLLYLYGLYKYYAFYLKPLYRLLCKILKLIRELLRLLEYLILEGGLAHEIKKPFSRLRSYFYLLKLKIQYFWFRVRIWEFYIKQNISRLQITLINFCFPNTSRFKV